MDVILECYTDGAYKPSTKKGGVGIVFIINNKKVYEYQKQIVNTTNNKCELLAVIIALNSISKPLKSCIIYSDSQYVLGCINDGWKRKKNIKYWELFDKTLEKAKSFCSDITFTWVKGHADNTYNNIADKLAVEASNYE